MQNDVRKLLVLSTFAALFASTTSVARADQVYHWQFTYEGIVRAQGTLIVDPSQTSDIWGIGGQLAVSGWIDQGEGAGYILDPSPGTAGVVTSLDYDNLIYPQGIPGMFVDHYVDRWGLLFGDGKGGGLAIYFNTQLETLPFAPEKEALVWTPAGYTGPVLWDLTSFDGGTFSLHAVPEPSSMALIGVGAGIFAVWRRRQQTVAG